MYNLTRLMKSSNLSICPSAGLHENTFSNLGTGKYFRENIQTFATLRKYHEFTDEKLSIAKTSIALYYLLLFVEKY